MSELTSRIAKFLLLGAVALATVALLISGLDRRSGVASDRSVNSNLAKVDRKPLSGGSARAVADLNAEFSLAWSRQGLQATEKADWLTVCRRLSLALVGCGMSLEEIRSLEQIPEADRIISHREQLLADRRFADYWGERLARSVVGAEEGPFLVYRRRRFVSWLSEQIATSVPYNEIVLQLITGRGYFTDRPEVNFHTVTMESGEEGQPDPILLAGRTSRAFLGMRIDCLQCHDDFLGNVSLGSPTDPREGTQQDFHQLAAFYSDARFNFFKGINTEEHPYEYKYLYDDEKTRVEPTVPFALELLPETGSDSERLAKWVTDPNNRPAGRAFANRTWALMFGRALNEPVDDIPLNGPLPPGLDRLADAVVEENWDLRQLIRIISETSVFQLDSRADFEINEAHEEFWAVFPLVRLRPEQVARSVMQASRLTTIDDAAALTLQLLAFGAENDFVERYGDTGEDEFEQDNLTITQRLLMMNGDMVRERIGNNPILNASSHINMLARDDKTAIELVYLSVLNREPTRLELESFLVRVSESDDRITAIEDLYWVLLNGSELAWNH